MRSAAMDSTLDNTLAMTVTPRAEMVAAATAKLRLDGNAQAAHHAPKMSVFLLSVQALLRNARSSLRSSSLHAAKSSILTSRTSNQTKLNAKSVEMDALETEKASLADGSEKTMTTALLKENSVSLALREMALDGLECRPTLSHLTASFLASSLRKTKLTSRLTSTQLSLAQRLYHSQPSLTLTTSCVYGTGLEPALHKG